jgi:hypothetical protein
MIEHRKIILIGTVVTNWMIRKTFQDYFVLKIYETLDVPKVDHFIQYYIS